ncbi:MAG: SDR family NAD(P)-dependent oxidoreductase [Chitinophagaceae bacterium]|nr:SDR family NAD(P)-dependent oxidoreductase [Chitinophagaceae bacterium]
METLKGKNVLIAGVTGSIGSALAKLMTGSGANVYIAGRNTEKLKTVAAAANVPPGRVYEFDITDASSVQRLADQIHVQVPSIDILINTTGIGIIKPVETLSPGEFQLSL